jgi:hypothetical protein
MDERIIKLLFYESLKFNYLSSYKDGFTLSCLKIIFYHLNCLWTKSKDIYDFTNPHNGVVCFWQFKNEQNAIKREIENGKNSWLSVEINPRLCKGFNWRKIFWINPFLIFKFLIFSVYYVGFKSLRSFSQVYIGYALYKYLIRFKIENIQNITILTTNMLSPVSIAVNEFARTKGFKTYYLEHAITPRLAIRGMKYSYYIVRTAFTKSMMVEQGITADSIEVNQNYFYTFPPKLQSNTSVKKIGIAINELDSTESIQELVFFLQKKKLKITIRVHDADKRYKFFSDIASKFNIEVESATRSSIIDFFKSIDFIFVGNSTVLFDAILHGVPVCYYWKGDENLFDYYNVVKSIGCPSARSIKDIGNAFIFYNISELC